MATLLRDWNAGYVRENEKIIPLYDNQIGVYKILWMPSLSWWGATECFHHRIGICWTHIYHESIDVKFSELLTCNGPFQDPWKILSNVPKPICFCQVWKKNTLLYGGHSRLDNLQPSQNLDLLLTWPMTYDSDNEMEDGMEGKRLVGVIENWTKAEGQALGR